MKRFLILLLSIVLTVGMLSLTTFAEEEPVSEPDIVLEAEEPAEVLTEEVIAEEVVTEPEEAQPEEVAAESEEAQPEEVIEEPAAEPEGSATELEVVAESETEREVVAEPEVIAEPETEREVVAEPEVITEPAAEPEEEPAPAEEPEEIVVPEEEVVLEKADAKDISSATVTLKYSSLTYTGKPRTQTNSTVVKVGSKTLVKGTDYKITYKNNINVGTATMTVTGIGKYTGSVKKTFKITAKKLTSAKLKYRAMKYTGEPRKNTVTVYGMYQGKKTVLKENKDYKLTYENNTKVGLATVNVKGIGNYKGTITKTFTIKPSTITFTRTWVKADGGYKGKITASGGASWTVNVTVTPAENKYWYTCGEIGVCNGLYYYYAHGKVYGLNIATGKQVWKTGDFGVESVSSAFDEDGILYLVAYHNGSAGYVKSDGWFYWNKITTYDPNEDGYGREFCEFRNLKLVSGKDQFTVDATPDDEWISSSDEYDRLLIDKSTIEILDVEYLYYD